MKLDIVYISYNQAPYVADALNGIIMQQLPSNIEARVLIADDCSSDGTLDVIKGFECKSPIPFVYLESSCNVGMLENYRRVFRAIEGDYVAILEGDDYWTDPLKLQKQILFLSMHPECGMCYTDCSVIGEGESRSDSVLGLLPNRRFDTENPIFIDVYFANLTWVFRKDMIRYFVLPDFCTDIPLLMFYEMCLHSKLGCVDENTGVFRVHSGSVTNSPGVKKYWFQKGFFLVSEYYARLFPNAERNLAHVYTIAIYEGIYRMAKEYNDTEIVKKMEDFYENKLDLDTLTKMQNVTMSDQEKLTQQLKRVRSSLRYRLGYFILHPIDFIQKFSKKR